MHPRRSFSNILPALDFHSHMIFSEYRCHARAQEPALNQGWPARHHTEDCADLLSARRKGCTSVKLWTR